MNSSDKLDVIIGWGYHVHYIDITDGRVMMKWRMHGVPYTDDVTYKNFDVGIDTVYNVVRDLIWLAMKKIK